MPPDRQQRLLTHGRRVLAGVGLSRIVVGILAMASMSLIVAIANSATAAAHDHRPPKTTLHVAGAFQRGSLYQFDWIRRYSRSTCVDTVADGVLDFPPSMQTGPGPRSLVVKFHRRYRPKRHIRIASWSAVGTDGSPVGDPTYLSYSLSSRGEGRQRRWLARFDVTVVTDVYLAVSARWRDHDGCGGTQGASWAFHVSA
ncbi:MAG: hypothetical protein QOG09_620 [Solirubrobacterales bacterium]|jgi:hypothetical protein|nr:hypothetical protein [Solirubrobacterales bacterium]